MASIDNLGKTSNLNLNTFGTGGSDGVGKGSGVGGGVSGQSGPLPPAARAARSG